MARSRGSAWLVGAGVAVAAANAVAAPAATTMPPPGEVRVYKKIGDRELKLFIVRPADGTASNRRPAIVFFHGGGWVGGSPGQFSEHARYFASRGLVCIQAEYRLLDRNGRDPPTVCCHDAKSAMRWVRAHAEELGIDPNRIAAAGGSVGGHLAAFVGMVDGMDDPSDDLTVSAKANALLLFNPVFDNGPDGGWGTARVGERYKEFSPAHNVSADDPPAIVFLGTQDNLIPVATVQRFQRAMAAADVICETRFYEGQPHGFFNYGRGDNRYYYETTRAADEFLAQLGWLHGPPTLASPPSAGIIEEGASSRALRHDPAPKR